MYAFGVWLIVERARATPKSLDQVDVFG